MKSNVREKNRFAMFQNEHLNVLLDFFANKLNAYLNEMI